MRFLVGNYHLHTIGGSESFTHAIAEELLRRGHEVDLYAPASFRSEYAEDLGLELNALHGDYDFALVSHYPVVDMVLEKFSYLEGRIIQTCHGLIPTLEKPNPWARLVVISEEIQHVHGGTLVRNGVNLDRFKPSHPLPEKPERLLSLSQSEEFNTQLSLICEERGIEFRKRNKHVNPIFRIEEEIKWADIVVGIGRSAIEAMACGRAVLVADHRPYQAALTDGWAAIGRGDHEYMISCNYSGRRLSAVLSQEYVAATLKLYAQARGHCARGLAEKYHNIRDAVDKYLALLT